MQSRLPNPTLSARLSPLSPERAGTGSLSSAGVRSGKTTAQVAGGGGGALFSRAEPSTARSGPAAHRQPRPPTGAYPSPAPPCLATGSEVSGRAGTRLRQPTRQAHRITSALWCLNVSKNSSSVAVSTAILAAPRRGSASGSEPALPGQRCCGVGEGRRGVFGAPQIRDGAPSDDGDLRLGGTYGAYRARRAEQFLAAVL